MIFKFLIKTGLLTFTFLFLVFLVKFVGAALNIGDADVLPPTSDNPEGSYDFSADFDGAVPTHSLTTRTTTNDIDHSYLNWPSNYSSWPPSNFYLTNMPEYFVPSFLTEFSVNEPSNEPLNNIEVNSFIFRYPFDNVNLFGGGYSIFADYYNAPTTSTSSEPQT